MTHRLIPRIASALATLAALPALAHVTSGATPHWHAGDARGVLAVFALTGAAVWLDRRTRR
jgi:integral membrane sensor domain MASE1